VRHTAGILIPVVVLANLGQLQMGVAMALGSVCVSMPDNPGPIHHRRNAMLWAIGLTFCTSLLVGLSAPYSWLIIVLVAVLPFLFSIIGSFGARATSIGMAGMLVMILNIDKTQTLQQVLQNALLTAAGGFWYFILSVSLYQLRPHKLVQQVLGDCMQETARYLRLKAGFYEKDVNYENNYKELTESQVRVHQKQEIVRELLFKTRSIVRESTHTGRVLLMSFLDTIDLFERIMTSQQEYKMLHEHFDKTGLLQVYREAILQLSDDLLELGLAFQEGRPSKPWKESAKEVLELEETYTKARIDLLNEDTIYAFISLRHILDSIKDLQSRIDTLHLYSTYDQEIPKPNRTQRDYQRFVARSDYNPKQILANLNIHSNIFRHSLRVSLALLAGYILSLWLPLGHDYWLLLTIMVILKPGYSLTRQRNFQRMGGTVIGAAIAAAALYGIREIHIQVLLITVFMIMAYSLIRINYFISVIFMTAYVIIGFHYLKPGDINVVLQDRVVDTAIGSAISFLLIFLIPPKWEKENIISLSVAVIKANKNYFDYIAGGFSGNAFVSSQYKLRRKDTFVALANLADAFQRMLNEPKSKQQKGQYLHQLVVSTHMLASHIASLSAYRNEYAEEYSRHDFKPLATLITNQLEQCENILEHKPTVKLQGNTEGEPIAVRQEVENLITQRQQELRQGSFETENRHKASELKTITDQFEIILRVAGDIKKVCKNIVA
jgi:uncharacterized membrane protein YccC